MKKMFFIALLLAFTSGVLHAQSKTLTQFILRSFWMNTNPGVGVNADSCYYSNTLLKFEINKKSKVTAIEISDNAENWWKEEISDFKKRLDLKKLDSLVRKDRLKKCTIVLPVVIMFDAHPCRLLIATHNDWFIYEKFLQFNGKNLKGKVIFLDMFRYGILAICTSQYATITV